MWLKIYMVARYEKKKIRRSTIQKESQKKANRLPSLIIVAIVLFKATYMLSTTAHWKKLEVQFLTQGHNM